MSTTIVDNLRIIQNRINNACNNSGRPTKEVRLLLASKTVSPEKISIAMQEGVTLMGENKAQEFKDKCNAVAEWNPEIHFIGHLQSNKIKEVLKWCSCIQSIDRLSLAEKLQQRLSFENKEIDVYIQVNTSNEESKFGVSPENAIELIKQVSKLKNIHIKGLMTIGLLSSESNEVRKCFKLLKAIQKEAIQLNIPNVSMDELSMGMSNDLEIAIEEGATIVRVGTAIFGERIYPDSFYWNEQK
ncbi:YggS family pyridoxal phosphate-dependent enzyme [Tenacibaculum aiptasiae]|uniref:Pyridoxal phosphate homeostasis protein n=1 Tax=Tenacibaculum aiptasiae TaxID=426481 RepID=A0A7J5A920_9FLAO|nr:YggS family pyridoxal phosphate-dependent enzyme [Tenacibaculum aiptasiae]KAB1153639.1 YggS family pyridoxal phosphate-dependent enzyme [Tenacibaculum aiptasiae]